VDTMCFHNFPYPSLRTFLYYSLSFICALSFTSEDATPYVPSPRTRVDATLVGVSTELHYGGGIFPVLISLFHFSNPFKLFTSAVYGLSICCTFLPSKLGALHGLPFKLSALTKGPVLMCIPLCLSLFRGGIFLRGLRQSVLALNTL
jgi:hypothetical protein